MPPRRSARTAAKAAATTASSANVVPVPSAAPQVTPPASSTKKTTASKRGRDRTVDDDEPEKPTSKKAKKVTSGAKKTASDTKKATSDATATVEDEEPEKKKMVTVLKCGAAPVDPNSPYVDTHQVYVSPDGEVWDAMLNQTNIGKNANKFYVLQLLHPRNNNATCVLFLRWGRTGENGQSQSKGPFASAIAINEFKKQFRSKTATAWEHRKGMDARPGKYTWLERDFESSEKDNNDTKPSASSGKQKQEPEEIPDSTLSPEIQNLCKFIFSTTLIDAALSSMNYDANKLPLGKLSKATILRGFEALKALAEVIETPAKAQEYGGLPNACAQLSGRYYSIIPHNFGRQKPVIIQTMPQLKKELELVDALGDMEIAQKLINTGASSDEQGNPINPIDVHFRSLDLESMVPISSESKEFAALAAYARDTHGSTHYYQTTLATAFRVRRKYEDENWATNGFNELGDGQRLLLWHGSRSTNFAGILSQGLRIAPPEAPVNGYMFGKGVYFADMMSKSYNYCYAQSSGRMGILLLCDVAAKPSLELLSSSYNAAEQCKSAGKLTTLGVGRVQPVQWQDAGEALDNDELKGCLMPKGPAEDVNPSGAHLQYNEYIVYNTSQIRVKYLLMVKMDN